jgi:glycosyltransferase involved in cell wall biosynthesis
MLSAFANRLHGALLFHRRTNAKRGSKIRVLQLGSPTGLYGAERWILALLRHLDTTAIEPIVSVIRDAPTLLAPLCTEANAVGVRTHVFEAYGKMNWSAVQQVRDYIMKNDIDILHTHGYKTDIIGRLATAGTRCRIVSTPHGWSNRAGVTLRIYESIDRALFPFFDAIAPLSEAIYRDLERIPGLMGKLHLIRNGVDITEIDAVTNVAYDIARWKAHRHLIFGYIGQLIPGKGLIILLKAFAKLDLPEKKLAVIGEGNQRVELEQLSASLGISNEVRFFGYREDRLAFLKALDVFVLPSSHEGIPRCLMEAMAAEVTVVASEIPGCTDLITHGQTGLLFQLDSVDVLLARLQECRNTDIRNRLTRRARKFVVDNYSAASMAHSYYDLYKSLLTPCPY